LPILPVGNLLPEVLRSALFAFAVCLPRSIFSSRDMPRPAPVEAMTDFFMKLRRSKFSDMIYLSNISVVLSPMNTASPFIPSTV
jgi:hypothetical protein